MNSNIDESDNGNGKKDDDGIDKDDDDDNNDNEKTTISTTMTTRTTTAAARTIVMMEIIGGSLTISHLQPLLLGLNTIFTDRQSDCNCFHLWKGCTSIHLM